MLLPPDMREWVKEDDLAHFIVDAISMIDLSSALTNEKGTGSAQYPPAMMLSVLIYCYANGIFSSRRIERATYQHLSVRYLAGNTHPDHDTIATFRRRNGKLLQNVFLQLLQLAQATGVLKIGTISLDGTKLEASATKRKTFTYEQLQKEIGKLTEQIEGLLKKADAEDQDPEQGKELPEELASAQARRERLLAAKHRLEAQAQERHERREEERKKTVEGEKPRSHPKHPKPKDAINLTDPESSLTPTSKGGFIQGYNAQVVVSTKDRLIIAADVVADTNDMRQLQPMVEQTINNIGVPGAVLVDSGYENTRQIMAVEEQHGCPIYCPPVEIANAGKGAPPHSKWRQNRMAFREKLKARITDPAGKALYKLRGSTVEPTFGILKSALGFRRFHLRGLKKVRLEWTLLTLAFNCKKLAFQKG